MYDSVHGSPTISSSFARFAAVPGFPNKGISIPSNAYLVKNMKSNAASLIVFFSFGAASLPGSIGPILGFLDNGTAQCFLGLTVTGGLQFYLAHPSFSPIPIGPSSALGLISTSTVPNHGIEIATTFSATAATIEVWLDGAIVIALTSGLNNINSGNAYANQILLGAANGLGWAGSGQGILCDYLRVWDATGSYQNAPVGYDVRKLTKLPAGAGALTQWTPNGAGANYQCVDENPPDDDTTYVSSSSTNSDAYAMGSSGFSGVPSQVVVKSRFRKDDAATRTLQIGVRSGSSNSLAAAVTAGGSYVWTDACISLDPATGSPPTNTAADAFQHLKFESS